MKSQVNTNRKIIRVEWFDHCSNGNWMDFDEADDWCKKDEFICVTVGWLWYEDSKVLVVAQNIAPSSVSDLMKILKTDIVHKKIIKQ